MEHFTELAAWSALARHVDDIDATHLSDLFDRDPSRFERFSIRFDDVLVGFSKNRITEETITLLLWLAQESHLRRWIERMFSGERINVTEGRAALHVARRNRSNSPFEVD